MSPPSLPRQSLGLAACLAIVFVAAAVGAAASTDAGAFYAQLVRPVWAPPGWAFGPVWTALYLLMGVAAWLVWRKRGTVRVGAALALFMVQLCANALWSWVFFVWRDGALAFAEVLLLLMLIVGTVAAFWRVSRWAAALMLPYLAWVCLATALTWSVWRNNPALL